MAWREARAGSVCGREGVQAYAGRGLTLGDAIWKAASVLLAERAVGVQAYLGGDQGGEGATLDEAHLDGCASISINCTLSAGGSSAGHALGLARRWGRDGDREVGEDVEDQSCEFCGGIFRQAPHPRA